MRRIPILGIGVVASLFLTAGTATAAMRPAWKVQSTPNPSHAKAIKLVATSCASASACTAVGDDVSSSGAQVTLAEGWNGSSWAIEPTPSLTHGINPELAGVSCSTTTSCIAVGGYEATSEEATLAEHWDGSSWTIQPAPATTNGFLSAVSCVSTSDCTAVGWHDNSGGTQVTLAERWNGSSWAIQPTPILQVPRSACCWVCRARQPALAPPLATTTIPPPTPKKRWQNVGTEAVGRSSPPPFTAWPAS